MTHVYEAISYVIADLAMTGIKKDGHNPQGYKFRGIDAVYNALAPKLAAHKLCILPRVIGREVTERATQKGGVLFYTVLDVEFDFVSAVDGSKHTVRTVGEAMDSADKSSNKAMSAAYKYACLQAFCIPTEGDNDPDATTHDVAPIDLQNQIATIMKAPDLTEIGSKLKEAVRVNPAAKNELTRAATARKLELEKAA